MRKIQNILSKILGTISALCLVGVIVVVLIQIFSRTLLPEAPAWTEELSRFFFITGVFYAVGLAKEADAFVNVDIIISRLNGVARKVFIIMIDIVLIVFMFVVFLQSIHFYNSGKIEIASTLPIHMDIIYGGTVSAAFFFVVYSIFNIINTIVSKQEKGGDKL